MPHYWCISVCVCVPHVLICKWNSFCVGSFPCEILRFSQWQVSWRLLYSGMWFQVVWLISSEILEKPAASIFYINDGCRRIFCNILHVYQTAWHRITEDSNFQNSFPVFNHINCNYHETSWTKSNAANMHKIITSTATIGYHSVVCFCVSYLPAMRPWQKSEGWEVCQCSRLPNFSLLLHPCLAQSIF